MKLPVGSFSWVCPDGVTENDILSFDPEGDFSYLFSVDLMYPEELHEKHDAFPLAPHNVEIRYENLSPFAQKVLLENEGNKSFKCTKLVASFLPRKKYVLHLKNLQLYLKLGLKITKIHYILGFYQEAFLEPYITSCTQKRQQASNLFEKNLFKLMCNSGMFIITHFSYKHNKIFVKKTF